MAKMTPEFNLIDRFFNRSSPHTDLGIGDDAALVSVSSGQQLAISTDMLVSDKHFFADADPYSIGWKSLAVNISDMAAMGALAKWVTLAISIPEINKPWLEAFSNGFFACAEAFNIALIGGDTTRGPLTISVTIIGEVPNHQAITRAGALDEEDIWVSGNLGSAALGLAYLQGKISLIETDRIAPLNALHQPKPRLRLGLALRGVASSCIDISDGLIADLGHILKASHVGAHLKYEAMPVISVIQSRLQEPLVQQCILAGGDDYELCFTAPKNQRNTIISLSQELETPITLIGKTTLLPELVVYYHDKILTQTLQGFDHFA